MRNCFVFSFFFNLFPFSFWQISICFQIVNCCCLFSASVTASRWRSLLSSNVSLAFPYSPVARLSPYSNGINTPSFSKTSNKAILTPERTGNVSTSWPAACFVVQSPKNSLTAFSYWKVEGDLVMESVRPTLTLGPEKASLYSCLSATNVLLGVYNRQFSWLAKLYV